MRALRTSVWLDPYKPPLTTVVFEDSTIDTLESIREQLRMGQPNALFTFDIFDWPHGDDPTSETEIAFATVEGINRIDQEQEAHMAMLYYWVVHEWVRVRPPGALIMNKPAPLTRENYEYTFHQLAHHPERPPISIMGVIGAPDAQGGHGFGFILDPEGVVHVEAIGPEAE